ncbi:MAG: hypothetical protein M1527_02435 [Gammaproteobacteria bacterium]|nr:hypothetical protein [Gammaproteobacteria bacterium]
MDLIFVLAGGMLLGVLHSFDPDHLAAMTSLVHPGATRRNALRAGLLWGIGHSLVLCSLVLLLIWFGFAIRPILETGFEVKDL